MVFNVFPKKAISIKQSLWCIKFDLMQNPEKPMLTAGQGTGRQHKKGSYGTAELWIIANLQKNEIFMLTIRVEVCIFIHIKQVYTSKLYKRNAYLYIL